MAVTARLGCLPREVRRRKRLHRRSWAFQPMSWMGLGRPSIRRWICSETLAGKRYAQAASTRARRARVLPVLVMPLWRRVVPLE